MNRGIVYIATGDTARSEATRSAERLSELVNYPITLISDEKVDSTSIDNYVEIKNPNYDLMDKVENFNRIPYDKCLYLDSDTYVCDSKAVDDLFELLERFDIATTLDSARRINKHTSGTEAPQLNAPYPFPEPNTGVIIFRKSGCKNLISKWHNIYREHYQTEEGINDQGAFHDAVYLSDVDFGTFSPEYNFRIPIPHYVRDPVKILHGHACNFEEIEREINEKVGDEGLLYYPVEANPYDEPHRILPVINPGKVKIGKELLLLSLSEFGIVQTSMNILLGSITKPQVGYMRSRELRESVQEVGWVETFRRVVSWADRGEF